MAVYAIKKNTLENITSAIREKLGTTESIKTKNIPNYILSNLVSRGEINKIIDGTITSIYNTDVISIRPYAFNNCISLTDVTFTEAVTVGSNAFSNCTALANLSIPKVTTIESNAFSNCKSLQTVYAGVSEIYSTDALGVNLISNTNLKKLNLPNCIMVYSYAVKACTALEEVNLPKCEKICLQAFYDCSNLKSINLPNLNSTMTIGDTAFRNCTSLEYVSIPNISSLAANAFYNCPSLKELYAPDLVSYSTTPFGTAGVSTSGGNLAWESVTAGFATVPALWSNQSNLIYASMSNATTVAANAFKNCISLNDIYNIGQTERKQITGSALYYPFIYNSTFKSNSFYESTFYSYIYYKSSITLNAAAFCNIGITELKIGTIIESSPSSQLPLSDYQHSEGFLMYQSTIWPNNHDPNTAYQNLKAMSSSFGQINIKANAFSDCSKLTNIIIDNHPISIEYNAFNNCSNLASVELYNVVSYTLSGNIHPFNSCIALNSIAIGGTMTTIPQSAFKALSSLVTLNLLNASIIGNYACQNCYDLKTVTASLAEKINTGAFYACSSLVTLSFPAATNIGASAFQNCIALESLNLTGSTVVTLANVNAFTNTPMSMSTLTGNFGSIYVPSSLYASYIAATNWKTYSARFVSV